MCQHISRRIVGGSEYDNSCCNCYMKGNLHTKCLLHPNLLSIVAAKATPLKLKTSQKHIKNKIKATKRILRYWMKNWTIWRIKTSTSTVNNKQQYSFEQIISQKVNRIASNQVATTVRMEKSWRTISPTITVAKIYKRRCNKPMYIEGKATMKTEM